MKYFKKMISWWFTPKLPVQHVYFTNDNRPKGKRDILKAYFARWLVHPVRRRMAKNYLKILQKMFNLTVIGITGSAGKTTTKEMLASILNIKAETVYSYKNIDPVYNIPMTILKCKPRTRYLVLEMGVEFPGEMDYYLWLAKPDIGVITNIFPTHTEFFGSTKGVGREKTKLVKHIRKGGFLVLNSQDKYLRNKFKSYKGKIIWFGEKGSVKAVNWHMTKNMHTIFTLVLNKNKSKVKLKVPGNQFVLNSLSAAAVCYGLNIKIKDIKKGLESYDKPEHRMNTVILKNNSFMIDDSYNNNPSAAKASLDTFTALAKNKKKIIVFGDMLELGKKEKFYHEKIGHYIAKLNPDFLICVGLASRTTYKAASGKMGKKKVKWFEDILSAERELENAMSADCAVLIKGSRSIKLNQLADNLYKKRLLKYNQKTITI